MVITIRDGLNVVNWIEIPEKIKAKIYNYLVKQLPSDHNVLIHSSTFMHFLERLLNILEKYNDTNDAIPYINRLILNMYLEGWDNK